MRCSSVPIHTFVHARFSPLIWWDKLSVPHSVIERAVPVQITRREGIWPSSLAWTHGARRPRADAHRSQGTTPLLFLASYFPCSPSLEGLEKSQRGRPRNSCHGEIVAGDLFL